jgi:HCO3- transporter family
MQTMQIMQLLCFLLFFFIHEIAAFRAPGRLPVHRLTSATKVSTATTKIYEPFGVGVSADIKKKLPFYRSDFTDGFNLKTVSSVFFLFYACIAPAVAFGGLLGRATNGAMGTIETVGATAIGGILYALFAGQPITIIGTTGPLLAFLKVLHDACKNMNVPFLPVYSWVGLWSAFLLLLASIFSTSNIVDYLTRFTDDIFSSLISVIFIAEAFRDIYRNFASPVIPGLQAFVSTFVTLATFITANSLSKVRQTPYLNRKVRDTVADFAPCIGVVVGLMSSFILSGKYAVSLPTLAVPTALSPTSGRPWLVDLFSVSNPIKLLCFLPALMATILLFMDQNITVRLIMAKENKLKKNNGIHLDLLVVSAVTAITSVLGMPWMVAATVRSLAHLRSLKTYETTEVEGGEAKIVMTGVQEQRLSGLGIHALIAISLVCGRAQLQKIPNAVLTGIFLYLGVSSIDKTELYQRTLLFLMDKRDTPKNSAWAKVGLVKTKIFTSIQLALLGAMWWVKGTKLGVFFPVLIGLLAPVRIALEKFNVFSKSELDALDGEIA